MSNDESTIKFEDLNDILTTLEIMGNNFSHLLYKISGFTLTIEIIVRHYNKLLL